MPPPAGEGRWDARCQQLTTEFVAVAEERDAVEAARWLVERADALMVACVRWRLVGMVDAMPSNRYVAVALGVAAYAGGLVDVDHEQERTDILRRMAPGRRSLPASA